MSASDALNTLYLSFLGEDVFILLMGSIFLEGVHLRLLSMY